MEKPRSVMLPPPHIFLSIISVFFVAYGNWDEWSNSEQIRKSNSGVSIWLMAQQARYYQLQGRFCCRSAVTALTHRADSWPSGAVVGHCLCSMPGAVGTGWILFYSDGACWTSGDQLQSMRELSDWLFSQANLRISPDLFVLLTQLTQKHQF